MTPSPYATIASDERAPVTRITLNRPDKRNPIGPLTCGELVHALARARDSDAVRVVVLTGAGTVFSAGGDLAQMSAPGAPAAGIVPASFTQLFPAMHALGKPIVAMVNGPALAGGLGLVVACDLVVASAMATFGLTEINLGLWPMMITAEIVRSIGRKKALELMLTGERIDAREAERIGLVNRVVEPADLEAKTSELAAALAEKSPAALRLGLSAFYSTQDLDFVPALAVLEQELFKVLGTEDAREGIAAFLQKRKPVYKDR